MVLAHLAGPCLLLLGLIITSMVGETPDIDAAKPVTMKCGKNEIANCFICFPGLSFCSSCKTGYEPVYGDFTKCIPCKEGYVGINCADVKCGDVYIQNCRKCNDTNDGCAECAVGAHRVGNECRACDSPRIGIDCEDNFCWDKIITHCKECVGGNEPACKVCDDDFMLTTNGLCEACPKDREGENCRRTRCDGFLVHDCKTCGPKDSGFCRECTDGYQLTVYKRVLIDGVMVSIGKCVPCPRGRSGPNCSTLKCGQTKFENCSTCTTDKGDKCGECYSGYAPGPNGECQPCKEGLKGVNCRIRTCGFNEFENCSACDTTDENACSKCAEGFYLDFTVDNIFYKSCIACPLNCARCESQTKCTQCVTNYSGEMCITRKCGRISREYCLECVRTRCTKCRDEATLSNNDCKKKVCNVPNCDECKKDPEDPEKCAKCAADHYLSDSKCVSCVHIPGCQSCTHDGVCTQCLPSASPVVLAGGKEVSCVFCESIAFGCRTCNGETRRCTNCKRGMFLYNNTCLACQDRCTTCLEDGSCLGCEAGYFVSGGTKCVPCMDNCALCSSAKTCGTCAPGYYLPNVADSEGQVQCTPCPTNCATCKMGGDTNQGGPSLKCTECMPGHYADKDGKCMQCFDKCISCTHPRQCSACTSGYYLKVDKTDPRVSLLCEKCDDNCAECKLNETQDGSVCTKARTGYYLGANNKVKQCIPNCSSCEDSIGCNMAVSGWYYNSRNETVKKCPTGCKLCIESLKIAGKPTCYACEDGYVMGQEDNLFFCTLSRRRGSALSVGSIIGIVVGIIIVTLVIVLIVFLVRLRKKFDGEDALLNTGNLFSAELINANRDGDFQSSEQVLDTL